MAPYVSLSIKVKTNEVRRHECGHLDVQPIPLKLRYVHFHVIFHVFHQFLVRVIGHDYLEYGQQVSLV